MGYPALPITAQPTYRYQIIGDLYGQTTINNYYFMDTGAGAVPRTTGLLEQMAVDIWGVLDNTFLPCVCPEWSLKRLVLESLNNRVQRPGIAEYTPGAVVGTHAGEADTPWVAARLDRVTDTRGLRGQGCVRISGIPLDEIEGSYIDGPLKTLLTAFGAALLGTFTCLVDPTFTLDSALVDTRTINVPPIRAQIVEEFNVRTLLASQKTRRTKLVT